MATTSLINFSTFISTEAKEITTEDTTTYTANQDIVWSSANSRGLLKAEDPLGNVFHNNTDKTSPDISVGLGTSSAIPMPTDGDGNIIGGKYKITLTLFDNANTSPTTFDASTVATGAIPIPNNLNVTQRVTYSDGGGSAIGGLTNGTDYYVCLGSNGSSILLSSSYADALAGTSIAITAGSGTQSLTAVDFSTEYVADFTFNEPSTDLDISWSVINPAYFKSVDNTNYDQYSYPYTISRTQTLFYPSVIGGSESQTGKTFNSNTFYTTESTLRLEPTVTYTADGYYSDSPSANVTYTITYTNTHDESVYVDDTNSVCQMYCCVDKAWESWQAARVGMKSNEGVLKQVFMDAQANWFMMKQSFECNQSQNVAKFRAEIERVTKCSGEGCECSGSTPTQVLGIKTTQDRTEKYTYTASADITSYTETELIGLSWADGDFMAFVDGIEVESTSGTASFNSATGEFTFGFTVVTGTEFYFQVLKG